MRKIGPQQHQIIIAIRPDMITDITLPVTSKCQCQLIFRVEMPFKRDRQKIAIQALPRSVRGNLNMFEQKLHQIATMPLRNIIWINLAK